jgi:hypothetical protein
MFGTALWLHLDYKLYAVLNSTISAKSQLICLAHTAAIQHELCDMFEAYIDTERVLLPLTDTSQVSFTWLQLPHT